MTSRKYTLQQLATIKYGKNQKSVESENGVIPIYGTGGLMGYSTKPLYDKPSVLIGRKGTIDKVHYVDHPFWTVDTLFYTEINTDIILPRYFYYAMVQVDLAKLNEGTTIPSLRTETLNRIEFNIPSIPEQRRRIDLLISLEKKISLNDKINKNLGQQAQDLFKWWFVDLGPFDGKIPNDWDIVSFGSFLDQSSEKSNDDSIPMYSVTDNGLFTRDKKFKKNLSMTNAMCKIIRENELVFGMSREILNWGVMHDTIGRVSAAYNVFHIDSSVNSYYLESYIKCHSVYFKDLIKPASREGQGIDKRVLMQKELLLPSEAILNDYLRIEGPLDDMINNLKEENSRLVELRNAILPRLMSGELDVSELDI